MADVLGFLNGGIKNIFIFHRDGETTYQNKLELAE